MRRNTRFPVQDHPRVYKVSWLFNDGLQEYIGLLAWACSWGGASLGAGDISELRISYDAHMDAC
jgi:hypothetical protein